MKKEKELKELIKKLKKREKTLLDMTYVTEGSSNEYWLGKWYEVNTILKRLEEILYDE